VVELPPFHYGAVFRIARESPSEDKL